MGTRGNKAITGSKSATPADARAKLGQIAEGYRRKVGEAGGEGGEAIRNTVRQAVEEAEADQPSKPEKAKKATKRASKRVVSKEKDKETVVAEEKGSKIENDKALESTGETNVPASNDNPAKAITKALRQPERVKVYRTTFPRSPDNPPPRAASNPPPVPPSPEDIQGPPVGPLVADMKERWVNSSTPSSTSDVAEKLRKIMSTSRAEGAREAAAAVKSERRAGNYPALLDEVRARRQAERDVGGPGAVERIQRTNATLIAELRRRTEQARASRSDGPAFVQGPEVADLVVDGKNPPKTPATPKSPAKPVLPKQYGLIRRLAKETVKRVAPAVRAIPRLGEDAAIVGAIGGGIYGLGAAGGVRGVGNYIMTGSTKGEPAAPTASSQEQGKKPAKPRTSYGKAFREKAMQNGQPAGGSTSTFRSKNRGRA